MATKSVLIIGGGFAGLGCARELAKRTDLNVTLVDKNNFHQFQPMLYQVATSQLAPEDLAYSLRKIFLKQPQIDVKLAEIATIDPKSLTAIAKTGEVFKCDYLVLAAGSRANFFGTPGAEQHAFPLYSLLDADKLRSRIIEVFEDANRNPKLIEHGALNFVIVGAGPTGVEMAGALADLIRDTMAMEYPHLSMKDSHIIVVDHGKQVLGAFSETARDYAAKTLESNGVELKLGIGVKEVGAGHALLSDGTSIKTRLVIWAGGLQAGTLAATLGLPQGHGGRIDVQPDLSVPGHPNVFALGDFANVPGSAGEILPQLGSVALQTGTWAGSNIIADLDEKPRTPFSYLDKGIMAMINRNNAIAEIGPKRHELHGHLAVAAWLGVHSYLMTGVRNRLDAFVNWTWNRFSKLRGHQVLDRSRTARINWDDDADGTQPVLTAAPAELSLVVLHCRDIEASKNFYTALGVEFAAEQHGSGPKHYSAQFGSVTLELYPRLANETATTTRLGFRIPSIETLIQRGVKIEKNVAEDPDGNKIELTEIAA